VSVSAQALTLLPGTLVAPGLPLARYRNSQISGCLGPLLAAATQPGDLIIEVACLGPTYIREALQEGRRVIALNVNPLPLLSAALALDPPTPAELRTALTHLGDLPKSGRPLYLHIRELYRSRCPTCSALGEAIWFVWERDVQRPFAKRVRCTRCAVPQEGPVDADDLALLAAFPPRSGPAYHLAVGRAAAAEDPLRERAAELVALYPPRALTVFTDLLHRLPQAAPTPRLRRGLTALLLEALDFGVGLSAPGESLARPRSFKQPARFVEHNLWALLETALAMYTAAYCPSDMADLQAESLPALLASRDPGYLLLSRSLQSLARILPSGSAAALVIQPAAPDALYWAFSALWATWLWGQESYPQLRPFLGRRRLDWDWYRGRLRGALQLGARLLCPGAPLLALLPRADPVPLATLVGAARDAQLGVQRWFSAEADGYRLLLGPALPARDAAAQVAATLRQRAEPTSETLLQAVAVIADPAQAEIAKQLSAEGFTQVGGGRWWLTVPDVDARPLADRVETFLLQRLRSRTTWELHALLTALYTEFSAGLSPAPALVDACLASYTSPVIEGGVQLRAADVYAARSAELARYADDLAALGARLGFGVAVDVLGACVWLGSDGAPRYRFHLTATALLAPLLAARLPGRACLVLPGSRAGLMSFKLQRDPRVQTIIARDHWGFIKFRHLRRIVSEIKSAGDLEVYLGLDPIVEQERVQIPLPLDL